MLTRFWELRAGCLLFLARQHRHHSMTTLAAMPPIVITLALIAALSFPLSLAVPATVAVAIDGLAAS